MFRISSLAFLVCDGLLAQSPPSVPISVDDAIREALERNTSLLAQRMDVSICRAREITARLKPNPRLIFSSHYMDLLGRGISAAISAGPPELSLRRDYTIEGGRKRERGLEVAKLATSVAELQLTNAIRLLVPDVQNAFVDVLLAKENLARARENRDALNGIVQVNESRA